MSWPFTTILNLMERHPKDGIRPIVVFFPPQEAQTALLHSLFVHELAHSAIDRHNLVDGVLEKHREASAFKESFAKTSTSSGTARSAVIAEASQLNTRLTSWTTELLCDALAIEYLGPTYIFAFAAEVLSVSWNEPKETHPPTSMRIAAMLDHLSLRGWDSLLKERTPATLRWLSEVGGEPLGPSTPFSKFLIDWTRRFSADITAVASERLGSNAYPPSSFGSGSDSKEVEELLHRKILPAQLRNDQPVDRRTILLAGWLQVFTEHGDSPQSIAKGTANDEFQGFLGAAMEMSRVLETWKQTA